MTTDVKWPSLGGRGVLRRGRRDHVSLAWPRSATRHLSTGTSLRGTRRGSGCCRSWEDQRFVGSNPALFSSNYGFAIGDASDPATVIDQLPELGAEMPSGRET